MQNLNQNRLLIGRVVAASAFIVAIFTRSYLPDGTFVLELSDGIGLVLLGICMLGRVYCTMQIGGKKNAELVTSGIYSVVRNPLYMFSFIGVLGIGLISNEMTVLAVLIAAFFVVYLPLIQREEEYLGKTFGQAFTRYKQTVPRLVPNFSLYRAPPEVSVNLKALHGSLRDAIWWLAPLIIFEMIEWLQQVGLIKPVAHLW